MLEYNSINESVTIIYATDLGKDFCKEDNKIQNQKLVFQYMLASDLPEDLLRKLEMEQRRMHRAHSKIPVFSMGDLLREAEEEEEVSVMKEGIVTRKGMVTKKKYKPVAKKVKPIIAELPGQYRIIRDIKGDLLENMLGLKNVPPPFIPKGWYTTEHKEILTKAHKDFLWVEEIKLMDHFMCEQNEGFAWVDAERGRFQTDFFSPIDFPVVPHEPYIERNISIPPGIYKEVCEIIKAKLASGVYELLNMGYQTRWFCVLKKDGIALRIVHSLEPLNKITIKHSGIPPIPDHMAEQFAGCVCGASLDLYVGYDEHLIAESSRDLTTL